MSYSRLIIVFGLFVVKKICNMFFESLVSGIVWDKNYLVDYRDDILVYIKNILYKRFLLIILI